MYTDNLSTKVKKSIDRLKCFEPEDGYYLAYSGGKDSDVIRILADIANVKHENVHNLTTVDAPETIRYIKSLPDVMIEQPFYKDGKPKTMWNLIVKKGMPPTMVVRYCCSEFKESYGKGKVVVTGVRWAEGARRRKTADVVKIIGKPKTNQKLALEMDADYFVTRQGGLIMNDDNDSSRRMVEQCYRTSKVIVNPIVDWTDSDVWEFLQHYGCKGNPLYECGYNRIGCIGCPMAGSKRQKEFERYPIYRANYVRAFDKMLLHNIENGVKMNANWSDGEAVMHWWLGENSRQMIFTFDD